jgi:tRNA (mo5U34)-methyltransferase
MVTPAELQAEADSFGWFHSIPLGNGVVTKGLSESLLTEDQLPDFAGRSVLDVGAWDGYYSFLAERKGASAVTAIDHYAWGVDFGARGEYWGECFANGTLPDQSRDLTDFWRPELPGQRGFRFAKEALDSKVQPVVADFATTDLDALGTFDIVLYLGVLYHMKEPLTCLERVRKVTRQVAVVETEALYIEGLEEASLIQFHPGGDLNADFGNWFVPTITALRALCRAAGFSRVETVTGSPKHIDPADQGALGARARRAAQGARGRRGAPPSAPYRAVVHAYV